MKTDTIAALREQEPALPAFGQARVALRLLVPLAITGTCLSALWAKLDTSQLASIPQALSQLPPGHLLLALALSLISFWAVGRYDAVAHRHFRTGIAGHQAKLSGTIAIALSQTLGFGVLTGAFARWRMLDSLGPAQALRLSVFVSLTFLMSWGLLTALACVILPAPEWSVLPAALALLLMPAALGLLSFARPFAPLRRRGTLPSLSALGGILVWATVDLAAVAAMLYTLIPVPELAWTSFVPVFLLALGAALLSSAPGGVGPFELVLLALLPEVPMAELIVGLVAFRVIYYALPALVAALALLRPFQGRRSVERDAPLPPDHSSAEFGVLRQSGGSIVGLGTAGSAAVWPTPQAHCILCDHGFRASGQTLTSLQTAARSENRIALLYKCSARTAALARSHGWQVLRIAQEASLDPRDFALDRPALRGLRRKLRQTEKARVTVTRAQILPLEDMARIDALWQGHHGTARGGSMGRYCPDYIARQEVFLAWQDQTLIAFATVHQRGRHACLDLMRHLPDAAPGTMYALVAAAIAHAGACGITGFSLAAAPDFTALPAPLGRWLHARAGGDGLHQFKSAFAPQWSPRYACAARRSGLFIALADIATEIHHPAPLPVRPPHEQDEEYELALNSAA